MKKKIAILGSTGSIGTQALEVVKHHPEEFEVEVLTAMSNASLLIKQAIEHQPNAVVIANENFYPMVKEALQPYPIKVFAGNDSLCQVVEMESIDLVLSALVGFSGLKPIIHAIEAGKHIALANKEPLVVAGDLVMRLASEKQVYILPVDSEHSAIFQCLVGEDLKAVEKIYLTASGGPFRGYTHHELSRVKKEEALRHPNWKMGCKITIDSASLMNKGLEVIEARWLFGLRPSQIEVIIHPQSVVHSMVQFSDGSIKAQLGLPDMRLPIQYALAWPHRLAAQFPRMSFVDNPTLTFEKPDTVAFHNLGLAYQALHHGGNMPCILNAANEVAVVAFLEDNCGFCEMSDLIEHSMQTCSFVSEPTLEDYIQTDIETRRIAADYLK
ncbi:MAG: 1-deoxy-D-xylulose-5-phosphate reductoisomerase [Bacteroidales bacterium]|nr:1-deoxy-D-xylulose-5-phosphate reductoisomerase [Bacteroidales bacterium]MDZ4203513.1 1-deoxy-D-xylulose-5-phosphate reductoisomerase [Bacteroidales bacterium]